MMNTFYMCMLNSCSYVVLSWPAIFICNLTHIQIRNIQYTSIHQQIRSVRVVFYFFLSHSINNPRICILFPLFNFIVKWIVHFIYIIHAHPLTCKHKMPECWIHRDFVVLEMRHICVYLSYNNICSKATKATENKHF